jgi:crossover junction endodeoxyribonuclease RuvC
VLGIDCGSERTGYGVIESDGGRHSLVMAGVIATRVRDPFEMRLKQISDGLREVIRREQPSCAAVEQVFYASNARTALKLAHVRGVALLAIADAGLQLGEYSPLEVKTSVVGYGQAGKAQVQLMVRSLLDLEVAVESKDACDALAVAICHATRSATRAQICGPFRAEGRPAQAVSR